MWKFEIYADADGQDRGGSLRRMARPSRSSGRVVRLEVQRSRGGRERREERWRCGRRRRLTTSRNTAPPRRPVAWSCELPRTRSARRRSRQLRPGARICLRGRGTQASPSPLSVVNALRNRELEVMVLAHRQHEDLPPEYLVAPGLCLARRVVAPTDLFSVLHLHCPGSTRVETRILCLGHRRPGCDVDGLAGDLSQGRWRKTLNSGCARVGHAGERSDDRSSQHDHQSHTSSEHGDPPSVGWLRREACFPSLKTRSTGAQQEGRSPCSRVSGSHASTRA